MFWRNIFRNFKQIFSHFLFLSYPMFSSVFLVFICRLLVRSIECRGGARSWGYGMLVMQVVVDGCASRFLAVRSKV